MKNIDIVIASHGNYGITYVCVMLARYAFPDARIIVFRSKPDINLNKINVEQQQELLSNNVIIEHAEDPLQGDRGAKTIRRIWQKYLTTYADNKYVLFLFQDCWIVHPNVLRKNLQAMLDQQKDGMVYHTIVRGYFCYGTTILALKDQLLNFYIDDDVLGRDDCATEYRMYDKMKNMNLYVTNPPEKAQSQYGFNYYWGTCHFHDKRSLQYYLDLHNETYTNDIVNIDWDLIPFFISDNETKRHRMGYVSDFTYVDKDIFPTGLDDLDRNSHRRIKPFDNYDDIAELSPNNYFATSSQSHKFPSLIPFATEELEQDPYEHCFPKYTVVEDERSQKWYKSAGNKNPNRSNENAQS